MKILTLISHTSQLLSIIFKSAKPADKIASEYFRSKKYIGSKERKFISEVCFHSLRNYNLLDYIEKGLNSEKEKSVRFNDNTSNESLKILIGLAIWEKIEYSNQNYLLNLMNLQHDEKFQNIEEAIKKIISDFFEQKIKSENILQSIYNLFNSLEDKLKLFSVDTSLNEISIRYSINSFIIQSLFRYITQENIKELLNSLTQSASLVVRLNTEELKYTIINMLNSQNINVNITTLSPSGIIFKERINLNNLDIFKNGLIEVQDEGSQLITFALNPERGSKILDACAGAGGKTLHIASLTNNKSEIIASDIDNRKLHEVIKRTSRCGFNNVKTVHIQPNSISSNIKHFNHHFDYILVDAPCSGSGTVRRMPLPKFRINEKLIERLQANQLRILNYYSLFLKNNGILVYSTCSILPQENQEVVKIFLKQNLEFKPDALKKEFLKNGINISGLEEEDFMLNLYPSIHNTDGFFIARFKKEV